MIKFTHSAIALICAIAMAGCSDFRSESHKTIETLEGNASNLGQETNSIPLEVIWDKTFPFGTGFITEFSDIAPVNGNLFVTVGTVIGPNSKSQALVTLIDSKSGDRKTAQLTSLDGSMEATSLDVNQDGNIMLGGKTAYDTGYIRATVSSLRIENGQLGKISRHDKTNIASNRFTNIINSSDGGFWAIGPSPSHKAGILKLDVDGKEIAPRRGFSEIKNPYFVASLKNNKSILMMGYDGSFAELTTNGSALLGKYDFPTPLSISAIAASDDDQIYVAFNTKHGASVAKLHITTGLPYWVHQFSETEEDTSEISSILLSNDKTTWLAGKKDGYAWIINLDENQNTLSEYISGDEGLVFNKIVQLDDGSILAAGHKMVEYEDTSLKTATALRLKKKEFNKVKVDTNGVWTGWNVQAPSLGSSVEGYNSNCHTELGYNFGDCTISLATLENPAYYHLFAGSGEPFKFSVTKDGKLDFSRDKEKASKSLKVIDGTTIKFLTTKGFSENGKSIRLIDIDDSKFSGRWHFESHRMYMNPEPHNVDDYTWKKPLDTNKFILGTKVRLNLVDKMASCTVEIAIGETGLLSLGEFTESCNNPIEIENENAQSIIFINEDWH